MQEDNLIVFKGVKHGLNICLGEHADFITLKENLRLKVSDAKDFFEDAEVSVTFSGRDITQEEEKELLEIIFSESNLSVSVIEADVRNGADQRAGRLAPAAALTKNEQLTFFYEGALRNGQSIRYDGSVVVLGDANPGSEIIAKGSVIVLGALKGLVHAGCTGDASSYVSALRMTPTQLRICDIITYIPEEKKNKNKHTPSYAYIQEGLIYIAPLQNG